RQIIVGNTNDAIEYVGQWENISVTAEMDFNWFGPTYNDLLRSTTGDSSLSFSFTGSSITLIGRSNFVNNSGTIFPVFTCSIDGIQIPNEGFSLVATNNYVLCDQKPGTLVDREHHFSLAVTASQQPFYFDRIEYIPSNNVSLSQATVKVNHTDPTISYGAGWANYGNFVNMTRSAGSEMTFPFVGKSVTWVSYYPQAAEVPQNASEGLYSIDGGSFTTFQIYSGVLDLPSSQFNQVFFKTPNLTSGSHVLKVVYQGSSKQMPLSLDYLYVENDTATSGPLADGPRNTPTISSPPTTQTVVPVPTHIPSAVSSTSSGHRDILIGGIIGGVLGGIVVLATCISLWLWHRKRQIKLELMSS
ncbi:hypothetical protein M422DRAFT_77821, partial [Sphaerobolus stellatus SS14]